MIFFYKEACSVLHELAAPYYLVLLASRLFLELTKYVDAVKPLLFLFVCNILSSEIVLLLTLHVKALWISTYQ